ncbi:cupin [Thalassotalea insulae]|uniref:Cupin n=1 Tax=Thalassotalea insulae TaxID=2056778 RepID=A0ABQ6GSB3_9GAMM|nr:cupin domain-containing protein [Thalassotalea insulae]GLX78807.1 cupin [Thalassotalea insulae]
MTTNNIFQAIPADLNDEFFELLAENKHVKIERIVSLGHSSPETGWYDQASNEWVIVLKGQAIISFEQEEDVTLACGDYLNIPAHKKHKVSWTTSDSETVWLAIHY